VPLEALLGLSSPMEEMALRIPFGCHLGALLTRFQAAGDLAPAVKRLAADADQRGKVIEGDARALSAKMMLGFELRASTIAELIITRQGRL
jgi:hypothetical protein